MKKWLYKLPALAIVLMVLFPLLPTPSASAHEMDHNMSMECMSGEDCEREMQKRCLEHCLEVAQNVDQTSFTLAPQIELIAHAIELNVGAPEQLALSFPHNHSPPPDPRLNRITVQRE